MTNRAKRLKEARHDTQVFWGERKLKRWRTSFITWRSCVVLFYFSVTACVLFYWHVRLNQKSGLGREEVSQFSSLRVYLWERKEVLFGSNVIFLLWLITESWLKFWEKEAAVICVWATFTSGHFPLHQGPVPVLIFTPRPSVLSHKWWNFPFRNMWWHQQPLL